MARLFCPNKILPPAVSKGGNAILQLPNIELTMKTDIQYDDKLIESKNLPRVSLIIPFRQEMANQAGLFKLLALAADKAEEDLMRR